MRERAERASGSWDGLFKSLGGTRQVMPVDELFPPRIDDGLVEFEIDVLCPRQHCHV